MNSSNSDAIQLRLRTSLFALGMASLVVLLVLVNISATAHPAHLPVPEVRTEVAMTNQILLLLSTPSTPFSKNPNIFLVNVFSAQYPFENTHIYMKAGEQIEFTVQGSNPTWSCNRSEHISPDGYVDAH